MSLAPGVRLGAHEILSPLGAGGMGAVYLAHDTRLERHVALKVLHPETAGDRDRLRRFVQEAKAASALNHPNILTVHEIGHLDDLHFIATEHIKGRTLRERLESEPLSVADAVEIARQVAAALNAAHEAGIVHRDVKPENVMIREDGIVKVLDFGLAKLVEPTAREPRPVEPEAQTETRELTEAGTMLGTVAYMSPEQACARIRASATCCGASSSPGSTEGSSGPVGASGATATTTLLHDLVPVLHLPLEAGGGHRQPAQAQPPPNA